MYLLEVFTKRGRKIILTIDRWNHLIARHPEMSQYLEEIPSVLQDPDIIIQSNAEPNTILYHKYYKVRGFFLVIVIEEEKGFTITAYTTITQKLGRVLWKR